jgi:hypothetical protein
MPDSGWLNRQLKAIKEEAKTWPAWLREAGEAQEQPTTTELEAVVDQLTMVLQEQFPAEVARMGIADRMDTLRIVRDLLERLYRWEN